jgi:OOP family OmpA-OmpF porin
MRRRTARFASVLLASAVLAAAVPAGEAGAQDTRPEATEIPDPGAPEGAVATAHLDRPFDRYALPVAPLGPGDNRGALRPVEGRVIWSAYRLEQPEASAAAVMAGYRARLGELDFAPILDCAGPECGGFDFRFAVELLPAPAMLIDTAEFAQFTAVRRGVAGGEGGAESFASVLVSRVLGAVYAQTVLVLPAEPGISVAPLPPADLAAAATRVAPERDKLLVELTEHGHVTLQGLDFETGGATLSAGSEPALETVARLLQEHPELSLVIVGHSDNQGGLDGNIALSKRRAEAVRAALVERGVAPERLEAHGIGFLAPVTSNATPEGKALNRRVELVLR